MGTTWGALKEKVLMLGPTPRKMISLEWGEACALGVLKAFPPLTPPPAKDSKVEPRLKSTL